MSNHDVVLCRSFGDEPLVRFIWAIADEGILICGQDSLDLSRQDSTDAVAVLAPFDAVYEYDKDLFPQLAKSFQDYGENSPELARLWQRARPYRIEAQVKVDTNK